MKKLLSCLFFLTIVFINAQNDNCSGAIPLTVGTDFTSGALTSTNLNATTDGSLPSCGSDAVDNVWFTVVVPASGKLRIKTGEVSGSLFNDSILTVYSGNCGALTEIDCNDDDNLGFSSISLSGQTPGTTLYISVWKYNSSINNGEFQISAYDPIPPANDNCSGATPLTVGTDFASGATTSSNADSTTDGPVPSCDSDAIDNVWFTAVVPQSGNLTIEAKEVSGSSFYDPVLTVYGGTCGSLTEISCSDDIYSPIVLTGQTPGTTLYISVWKDDSFSDNGEFQISAYDPIPPANDNCSGATPLTVGTDFASGAITASNAEATTDGPVPSCNSSAIDNVWFTAVVPQSGNLTIEAKEVSGSSFYDPVLTVYGGTCGSLTEISCSDDIYFPIVLTGQTPGTTLYISVWKDDSFSDNGEFQISAYDPVPPANDNCSEATPLTVGTDFASGAITASNTEATTDGSLPSCDSDAIDNVWFTAVVPQSGNLTIEVQHASGSSFYDPVLAVYGGTCGSLTEISCSNDIYSPIVLTGQTPGTTLYVSVWKYDSFSDNGEFQISAYDNTALSTHEVSGNNKKNQIFPNPFTDTITISNIAEIKSISIADASGRVVKTIEKPSSPLQLGDLKEGVYLFILKLNDGTVKTIKTIKK
ncbi:T9SS type A sorting domain-containing protein [Chryseobacterium panacisoli]|uniref:T9SS type A sorting domain-containing protein n=1 Tax=Chryseobacterium panacisoli TaxID=1807141 RepID=A0A5D8ZPL4_9FLAO|nr:T9SS type A sorting domain-containing protein [Chryseobacterium panacisoli]TZF96103.1 T9SS type A sorting domain-containing protein [Chryseobacterium panacisoli]